jgi:FkbM family methyltransferase
MITKVLRKFSESGMRGVLGAVYRRIHQPTTHPISVAIDAVTERPGFDIVQLGAFVGKTTNDPLFHTLGKRLKKIPGKLVVVEPVRSFYMELLRNYEGIPGVAFENVAISDRSGPATFYRLGVDPVAHGYPWWLSQLGSLKEERMTELWDQYEADIRLKNFFLANRVEEVVQCITFEELMNRHNLKKIDLLQIDVEGYEFEILKTIEFSRFPTRFINYECVLLHKNKAHAENMMRSWGYRLVDYGQDTFCYRRDDQCLARKWSRRPWSRFLYG